MWGGRGPIAPAPRRMRGGWGRKDAQGEAAVTPPTSNRPPPAPPRTGGHRAAERAASHSAAHRLKNSAGGLRRTEGGGAAKEGGAGAGGRGLAMKRAAHSSRAGWGGGGERTMIELPRRWARGCWRSYVRETRGRRPGRSVGGVPPSPRLGARNPAPSSHSPVTCSPRSSDRLWRALGTAGTGRLAGFAS